MITRRGGAYMERKRQQVKNKAPSPSEVNTRALNSFLELIFDVIIMGNNVRDFFLDDGVNLFYCQKH